MAHEFWISPENHRLDAGDTLRATLLVGTNLDGETYPYLSHRFKSFTIHDANGSRAYTGNEGDIPALVDRVSAPGLTTLLYHSKPSTLHYRKWEKFLRYTKAEGLTGAVEAHLAKGLPGEGFSEHYTRNAKSLVQVGSVKTAHQDKRHGMPFEIVALQNPFAEGTKALPIRLYWQQTPANDVQITVFRQDAEGSVTREITRTDTQGNALIPLHGQSRYLLNAVRLDRTPGETTDYASFWSSLTFAIP